MIRIGRLDKNTELDINRTRRAFEESFEKGPRALNSGMAFDEFDRHLRRVRNEELDTLYSDIWRTVESMD